MVSDTVLDKLLPVEAADRSQMASDLLDRYPWCNTFRLLSDALQGTLSAQSAIHLASFPVPSLLLPDTGAEELAGAVGSGEIIEAFLSRGEYRIVPNEEGGITEEHIVMEASLETEDDLVSEELAALYLSQGLIGQAREAYRKLSLLYPKKSVYFVEIIDGLDRRTE